MISFLTRKIFPDFCSVTKCPELDVWLYPIFKNGSSTIKVLQKQQNWKVKINEEISKCNCVTVILRDPISRFVSGYNTYLENTMKGRKVDLNIAKKMLEQDPFLDRHTTPQYNWISHLAFYISSDTKILIQDMDYLQNISSTKINHRKKFYIQQDELESEFDLQNNPFITVDKILYQCVGQSMTIKDINNKIKLINPSMYQFLFEPILKFANLH